MTHAIQTSFSFINNIGTIRNEVISRHGCNPSWIKITTITITSKFTEAIPVEVIKEYFATNKQIQIKPKNSNYRWTWKVANTSFYNQVSIYTDDHRSRKSVKLFPNGAVQVTGCCDMLDCDKVLRQISCVVSHIVGKPRKVDNYNIHMINSNFSLNQMVNLENVFNVFTEEGHDTTFNPDRYSAVKIKIKVLDTAKVTVSIFSSGRIIVTGAKALQEVAEGYKCIMETVFRNKHSITTDSVDKIEKFDMWRGSTIQEWLEKISQATITQ